MKFASEIIKELLEVFGNNPWVIVTLISLFTIFFAFVVILKIVEIMGEKRRT